MEKSFRANTQIGELKQVEDAFLKSEIAPLPYRVEPEPMSLADTLDALQASDDVRRLIAGLGGIGASQDRIWADWTRRSEAARAEAQSEEDRFNELVALRAQRCRERESVTRRLTTSQALEDPTALVNHLAQPAAYDRIIADLLELIEQQRAIAIKAKAHAARCAAVDNLVRCVVCNQEPPATLAAIFGVGEAIDLAPLYMRAKIRRERAEAEAAEARRQADAEHARQIERERIEAEAARFKVERAKIDAMALEDVAAMFFKDNALFWVRDSIRGGTDAQVARAQLEALAGDKNLFLSRDREYALDRLLKHFELTTVQERLDQRAESRREAVEIAAETCPVCARGSGMGVEQAMRQLVPLKMIAAQHGCSEQDLRRHADHVAGLPVLAT